MKRNTILLFAKSFTILLLVSGLILSGCNNDAKVKDKTSKEKKMDKDEEESGELDTEALATDVCDCISDLENGLSSRAKKIVIKAGNSDEPEVTMKEEILKITDAEEQEKIGKEFQGFEDTNMEECMKKLQKKYPDVKNPDKKTQKKILSAIEDNCSEFSAALMKIGFKTKEAETEK